MAIDPYAALRRSLEREQNLCWNLKELLVALDESAIGPTSKLLPRWQIERIEASISTSEDEIEMLTAALVDVEDTD